MGLALGLILLAILFAVLGIVLKAVKWLIIVAVVLFLFGLVKGFLARGKTGTTTGR